MKLNIYEQEIEIDLEEFAEKAANGDVIAFGQMLVQFCEHLEEREKEAGYSDLPFFNTTFGILIQYCNEKQLESLKQIIEDLP